MSESTVTQPKPYSEIAKAIIKGSIRSAICIDDMFQGPYMSADEIETRNKELLVREGRDISLDFDMPGKIYKSFRLSAQCDIDIYNFRNLKDSWHPEYMLSNKDLMIIDWELDGPDGYLSTIKILKETISAGSNNVIPFIIIYTAKPEADFKLIVGKLLEQFNPFHKSRTDMIQLFSKQFLLHFEKYFIEEVDSESIKEFLSDCSRNLYEYWFNVNTTARDTIKREIHDRIVSTFSIQPGMAVRVPSTFTKTLETVFGKSKDLYELLFYLSLDKLSDNQFLIRRIDSAKVGFKVNESIVCIFSKPGLGKESYVDPDEVFNSFSNLIVKDPHNFLTLLSLEMRGRLNKHLLKITENISSLDERAFFLHLAGYEKRSSNFETEFFDFLIKNWTNEIEAYNINQIPEIFEALTEYRKDRGLTLGEMQKQQHEIYRELALLAVSLSTHTIEGRITKDPKIRFGDIFTVRGLNVSESYFICVTPHCVCVDPQKVDNNFYFIKSEDVRTELKLALEKIETEYYSIIKKKPGEIVSVNWGACKPFTIWIENNNIANLRSTYSSFPIELNYITSLKETFAQRLANKAFNYGTSIGVDLPHLLK